MTSPLQFLDDDGRTARRVTEADPLPVTIMSPATPGDMNRKIVTAGQTLSASRLVVPQADGTVVYASNAEIADMSRPIWLTASAALVGERFEVITFGSAVDSSWAWTVGDPIFLATNGHLTQMAPEAPDAVFLVQVATVVEATEIFYDVKVPILLGGG